MAHPSIDEPSSLIVSPNEKVSIETVAERRVFLVRVIAEQVKETDADWIIQNLEPRLGEATHLFFDLFETEDYENMAKLKMIWWILKQKKKGSIEAVDAGAQSGIMIAGIQGLYFFLENLLTIQIHTSRELFELVLVKAKGDAMDQAQ